MDSFRAARGPRACRLPVIQLQQAPLLLKADTTMSFGGLVAVTAEILIIERR
jgi:hypothetical protein